MVKSKPSSHKLDFATPVVIQDFFDGKQSTFPVADLTFVSHKSGSDAFDEQATFLEEYLALADAEILGRFSIPPEASLREIEVMIPRPDLPDRLAIRTPLSVTCVLIPSK